MTPERWQQIETLYHAARERQASERAAFLAEACADDAGLRAEVEALLRADEVSHGIIDGNALEEAARLHPTTDPLQLGQQLGAYKILALLGKGGMGEVYRARDTRLEREVAIKVLPADFAQDAERLRRFEQEARATSALNHPNILTIYDLGQHEGAPFLVAELLEGEELRAQLSPQAKAGPQPLKRAIEYAQQIAAGLAAAHAKGIIHRDLKPENIFVTSDGRVKILDFGLAKLATPPKDSVRPDVATQRHLTMPGTVLGTVAYMSPEQVRGEVVDQRSDIFSFGQILYEMLAGQRAFDGATLPDLMAAILKEEPPELSGINPQVPPSLEKIVLRCLEKKPEQRFQTASDLGFALETLANARTSDARRSPAAKASGLSLRWHGRPVWLLAASVLVLLAVWAGWRFASSRVAPLPPAKLSPFTSLPGNERQPSFSPDGNQLVFVWDGATGDNADLYVKQVGNETLVRLTNDPAADTVPSWSPDGRTIAFIRELADGAAALSLIPSLGGPERRLTAVMKYPGERAISWSPDGNWLALRDRNADNEAPGIFLVSRTTGEKRRLTTPPAGNAVSDNFPAFSPDGRMIVFERFFAALVNDLFQVPVTGGEPQRLTFDGTLIQSPVWSPDGHELLFISWREGGTPGLWRMPAAGGAPERVPLAVRKPVNLAMSPQGNRLALTEDVSDANIWRMELPDAASGRKEALQPPSALIASTMFDANPQYSPDGKRIAFMSNRAGGHEIWLADSNGERPVALTAFNRIGTGSVTWSPDGSQLVFDARPEGNAEIYAVNIADRKLRRLTNNVAEDANPVWSRDGQWVYFRSARSGERHLWKMPAAGGEAIPVTQQIGHDCLESPDGQWLYFTKGYRLPGIWRMPVNGGEAALVLNHHNAGGWRHWTVTKKGIYFATNQQPGQTLLEFFSFATRQITLLATVPKGLDATTPGLSVSPDGRWLIWSQLDQQGSDLLLLDNFR